MAWPQPVLSFQPLYNPLPLADFTFTSPSVTYLENGSSSTLAAATGWVFTRSTVGYGQTLAGALTSFAIDAPRVTDQGLLIESAATNNLLQSQTLDDAAWTNVNVTVTADNTTAPDGTLTADKVAATATSATIFNQTVTGGGSASGNTGSIYAKKGTGATVLNVFALRNSTTATNLVFITLNYDTGAIAYLAGSTGASAVQLANGWWRVILSVAAGISDGDDLLFYAGDFGNSQAAGNFFYAWGGQVEAGTVPSSYIPTVAAPVTRGADAATLTRAGAHIADVTSGGATTRPATATPLNLGSSSAGAWVGSYVTRVVVR